MKIIFRTLLLAIGCFIAPLGGTAAAASVSPALFQESFHHSLGDYWCEPNRLSVADVDADGRKDIVLMATTLVTNGTTRSYQCRAILLRARPTARSRIP